MAEADDIAARFNHCKKRKKLTPSKSDNLSDCESPVRTMSVGSIREIDTSENKAAYETDNESDSTGNGDVEVEERDFSNTIEVAGEYDSSEVMSVVDIE